MMDESKKAAEVIQIELAKAKQYNENARRDFLTFTNEYRKEDGSLDFDKITADNRMNDYNSLLRFSDQASFEYAMVKDYIRSNSEVAFAEVEPMGFDFVSVAQRHDEITKDLRTVAPSQTKVEVKRAIGNTVYTYEKNVGEVLTAEQEANLYRGLLDKEVAKETTTKLGSPAFEGVKQEACTAIVMKINKEQLEQSLQGFTQQAEKAPSFITKTVMPAFNVESEIKPYNFEQNNDEKHLDNIRESSQGAQGETVLTPEQQAEAAVNAMIANTQTENTPSKSLGGFTATGLIAIMTGIVSIGLVILGTVLIK